MAEEGGLPPRSALDAAAKRNGNKRLSDEAARAILAYVALDVGDAVREALLRNDAPAAAEHLAHE